MEEYKVIENITKLNSESQNQRLRLFVKVDITTKLKILQHQKQIFHKIKSKYVDVDNEITTFSSLVLAIDLAAKELDIVHQNAIRIKEKYSRNKPKRQKIFFYWAIVKKLKSEENFSFRAISEYLLKHHRLNVAHSTISTIWNELEIK